jgi:hypothetical protein
VYRTYQDFFDDNFPGLKTPYSSAFKRLTDEEVEKRLEALERAADSWDSLTVSRYRFLADLHMPEVRDDTFLPLRMS